MAFYRMNFGKWDAQRPKNERKGVTVPNFNKPNAAPPKLETVTLRAGTRYAVIQPDGTLSGEHEVLDELLVKPVTLGPVFNVYEVPGWLLGYENPTIMVDVRDEVR